jgi:DNA mismatch repair protein MutS
MKLGYFPSIKSILRDSTLSQGQKVPRYKIRAIKQDRIASKTLDLDPHTLKDLEVFQAEGSADCLFDLYNSTRTAGGAQILRHRMENPFADAVSILQVQKSISYIQKHGDIFRKLGFWITGRVERYQRDPLMFVLQQSRAGFMIAATMLKLFDGHHYHRIFRGVQFTCLLVNSHREFLNYIESHRPRGELGLLVEDIKQILNEPRFLEVPMIELQGRKYLKILRLDQSFRVYEKEKVQELMQLTYEIDALRSLAEATSKYDYTIPEILDGPTRIQGCGLVHPQVENAIANEVGLDQENRMLFLTGPNMAGKTTYLRAISTALYLGHLGMGVPATSFGFTPVDRLFSSISISDNVHTGTSYFLAEVLRIKSISSAVAEGFRVMAIMDEPFKGTNVRDALEASLAIIVRLESKNNCLFLFSSHLIELDEEFPASMGIVKCHFEARETGGELTFDYLLQRGVSTQRLGMRVLSEQGIFALLDG